MISVTEVDRHQRAVMLQLVALTIMTIGQTLGLYFVPIIVPSMYLCAPTHYILTIILRGRHSCYPNFTDWNLRIKQVKGMAGIQILKLILKLFITQPLYMCLNVSKSTHKYFIHMYMHLKI